MAVFPPFPGFEKFVLRVEVEWQGRARFVVARLEALPGSPRTAVLVATFEDAPAEGEWLVRSAAPDEIEALLS